ncbi:MAG: M23 family metallopeptidase [Prevotella sp.]|nr:M23 family metallopeptidase [Prevotella sp.]
MKYSQEMILQSPSGYCMPFEEREKDVELTLGYGKQKHPVTGQEFFHHGVDFNAPRYLLSAVATGTVSGMGTDSVHGAYQIIRYGDYEVTYGHLSNVFATYGKNVKAGQVVSVSGDLLHMEVKYKGEELNPIEFLTMIYGNIRSMERLNKPFGAEDFVTIEGDFHTRYDKDQKEIEQLLLRYFPSYMNDLKDGSYTLPSRTEQSLRNIMTLASMKNYFFELIPSAENPMGLGRRSITLAEKVQNLLIEDFLSYLALNFGVFVSTWPDELKKKHTSRL